ncbi:MAG: hypothetical protein R6V12_17300 [Candidatus Hydrogenedentota bacterium]
MKNKLREFTLLMAGVSVISLAIGSQRAFAGEMAANGTETNRIDVSDFLPDDFIADGSQSCMVKVQQALDALRETGGAITFPPVTYLLDDAAGLRVHSNTRLVMHGARFMFHVCRGPRERRPSLSG